MVIVVMVGKIASKFSRINMGITRGNERKKTNGRTEGKGPEKMFPLASY